MYVNNQHYSFLSSGGDSLPDLEQWGANDFAIRNTECAHIPNHVEQAECYTVDQNRVIEYYTWPPEFSNNHNRFEMVQQTVSNDR
jgi:hypothetical protein